MIDLVVWRVLGSHPYPSAVAASVMRIRSYFHCLQHPVSRFSADATSNKRLHRGVPYG